MNAPIKAGSDLQSKLLDRRYAKDIEGTLGCYDRLIVTGMLGRCGASRRHDGQQLRHLNIRCFGLVRLRRTLGRSGAR